MGIPRETTNEAINVPREDMQRAKRMIKVLERAYEEADSGHADTGNRTFEWLKRELEFLINRAEWEFDF